MVDRNHKAHLDALAPVSQKYWVFCSFEKWVGPSDDHYCTINRLYGPFNSATEASEYEHLTVKRGCSGMHRFYTDDEKPRNVWECRIHAPCRTSENPANTP